MYSTSTNDTVINHLAAANAPSALVPLFTVTSPHPQVLGLAAAFDGRNNAMSAQASNDGVVGNDFDTRQLTTANCASFINALLTHFPVDCLTVTSNGSQATIAGSPAMYESLQRFWLRARGLEENKALGVTADGPGQPAAPFSPLELVTCLNAIIQHQASAESKEIPNNLLKFGAITVDDDRHTVTVHGAPVELRPMDYKLLRFLIAHPGRVFSRAQLLDKVWGGHAFVEERTVDTHVKNLRKSIGQCSHYVKTVHSVGYVLKST